MNCSSLGRSCGKCDTSKGRTDKVRGRLALVKLKVSLKRKEIDRYSPFHFSFFLVTWLCKVSWINTNGVSRKPPPLARTPLP